MSSEQSQEEINNDNMSSKKRRTASPPVEGAAAAAALTTVVMMPSNRQEQQEVDNNNNTGPSSFPTMEDLLGLPVEILFRQIRSAKSSGSGKPLMTRLEAGTFVKITLLAQELDVLIKLAENVSKHHIQYKQLCDKIIIVTAKGKNKVNVNPWLTPLLPLMYSLLHPVPSPPRST